jgi:hypothetical protein
VADDPGIPDDSRLLRRVPADTNHILWDGNLGRWRISSQAFKNFKGVSAFSVNLECVLQERGEGTETLALNTARHGLVALPARLVRAHGQAIEKKPEEDDPSHGHVVGDKPKPVMDAFASAVQPGAGIDWVVPPANWPWAAKA